MHAEWEWESVNPANHPLLPTFSYSTRPPTIVVTVLFVQKLFAAKHCLTLPFVPRLAHARLASIAFLSSARIVPDHMFAMRPDY